MIKRQATRISLQIISKNLNFLKDRSVKQMGLISMKSNSN
jgi:hypothetical protein